MNAEPEQEDWLAQEHARRTDPRTSKAAARNMQRHSKALLALLFGELKRHGPMTQTELALRTRLRPDQVWRRLSDLKNKKMIVDSGETRPGDSGRPQIVWKVA